MQQLNDYRSCAQNLDPVDADEADTVTVAVRLPSGRTPRRAFSAGTVNDLYAFATFKVRPESRAGLNPS